MWHGQMIIGFVLKKNEWFQAWLYGWFCMVNSFIRVFCQIVNTFFANILPKYFVTLSKDVISFKELKPLNHLKNQNSHFSRKNLIINCPCSDILYKAGHHINSTSLVALPSPCPTIREVFDDGRFLLTPCSFALFFARAISSSAERGAFVEPSSAGLFPQNSMAWSNDTSPSSKASRKLSTSKIL